MSNGLSGIFGNTVRVVMSKLRGLDECSSLGDLLLISLNYQNFHMFSYKEKRFIDIGIFDK